MTFDHPWWILAAIAVTIVCAILYVRAEQRKTANDLAYTNVEFFRDAVAPRQWIPRALRACALSAVLLAAIGLAGPHMVLPVVARDGSVFICIDTSGSMQSTDVQPTRAEAAKAAARAFIDETPAGTKIGIIAFSSSASVVAPLSADHDQVRSALDDVPSPNGATAIGDALQLAAAQFPSTGHRVVILVTDGVNNTGADPQETAAYLGAHHIPVYTVGIGTPNGDVIAGTGEAASIDEDALRGYAAASGGAYARADSAAELQIALARLGRTTSIERKRVPIGSGLMTTGFAVLLCSMLAGLALGRFP